MINTIGNSTVPGAQRDLSATENAKSRLLGQLSSGKRINSAADDPAGSAIVEQFAAQIVGSNQAARNLNDGISLAQTADGALETVQDNTQRIRELTVQAGNSTLSAADRSAIQGEVDTLSRSNSDTLRNANFNGQQLFQGGSQTFQAGPNANDQITVSLNNLNSGAIAGTGSIDLSSTTSATAALDSLDKDIDTLNSNRATLGALNSRFEASIKNLNSQSDNLSAAKSRIGDTDYAAATSRLVQENFRSQAELSVQVQANANSKQVLSLLR
ncbi:flagellin FliC [Chitinimonas arctica]|uniref:Flagellin n=1 Tax=Chitinimonas arctica TaxID=2594795 RepID=A0A516SDE9_9NEIS|nr:flagellin [Chitinimonas arctica]QDQ26171.1 flagellin FliC [Chitinimonas arctica]